MTPVIAMLIIAVVSVMFGYWFYIGGYIPEVRKPNKKAAAVCFLITLAAFIANLLLQ